MKIITQHTKQLAMVAYAFALAFTLGGCVNDLTNNEHRAENKETKETFNTKSFAGASSQMELPKTKTSGKYTDVSKKQDGSKMGIQFYWDHDDYQRLWVNLGGATGWQRFYKQDTLKLLNDGKIAQSRFYLSSYYKLTKEQYPLWYSYYGLSNGQPYTNIPYSYYQSNANDFSKLYEQGDCGFTTAVDNGIWYAFTLKHATSYITFMPYAGEGKSKETLTKCKLMKITLTTDEVNSGLFYFDENGNVDKSKWPTAYKQRITICGNGDANSAFVVPESQEAAKKNAAVMVMAPGTYHNVQITYTLYDPVVQTTGVFKKFIPELTLNPGKSTSIFSKLEADDFTPKFGQYHMWGATLHFWENHESAAHHNWRKGGVDGVAGYPQSGGRFYNLHMDPGANNIAPAGTIDRNAPSANFISYYVKYGDPRWDDSPFTYDGHLFTGRMWFLKRKHFAKEAGYNESNMDVMMNEKNANGTDFRKDRGTVSGSVNKWSDVPEGKRSNYFYVVALGYYTYWGELKMDQNYVGRYWTSTAITTKHYSPCAFFLEIAPGSVYVTGYDDSVSYPYYKGHGYQEWPGEN
jgi:lipoprotein